MKPLNAGFRFCLFTAALLTGLFSGGCGDSSDSTSSSASSSPGPAVTAITLSGANCRATNYDSYGSTIEYDIEISLSNYLSNNAPYEFAIGVSPADAYRGLLTASDISPSICEISLNADKTKLLLVPIQAGHLIFPNISSGTCMMKYTIKTLP